ncbi:TPA: adenylyl-sulfate kinase [Aeromonas salmonicida subsp. salmonicida]|uniref:adenylyl-sulfate kinase n=1 Tax=Aeromonas salmonicida TaxID=645 RepID=UPI001CEC8C8A|nr:adenylyl-sulfate kinase [Aeromonas salmonicida subsp. salmonicida]
MADSNKSTITNMVEEKLLYSGAHNFALDGNKSSYSLKGGLSFTDRDRIECDLSIDEIVITLIYSDLKITMIDITIYSR